MCVRERVCVCVRLRVQVCDSHTCWDFLSFSLDFGSSFYDLAPPSRSPLLSLALCPTNVPVASLDLSPCLSLRPAPSLFLCLSLVPYSSHGLCLLYLSLALVHCGPYPWEEGGRERGRCVLIGNHFYTRIHITCTHTNTRTHARTHAHTHTHTFSSVYTTVKTVKHIKIHFNIFTALQTA